MAGLAAATALAKRGIRVHLYEASGHAGGRCRSFHDARLDRTIDNGNHLVLSGNRAVAQYLQTIGASGGFMGPVRAAFFFVDVRSNERWCVRPSRGPLPWWVLSSNRRIPGTTAREYAKVLRIAVARPHENCACMRGQRRQALRSVLGAAYRGRTQHTGAGGISHAALGRIT